MSKDKLTYDVFISRVNCGDYNKRAAPYIKKAFKKDLLAVHEVTDNPKADKAFDLAWDYGHSYGAASVADYFVDMVELIK